MSSKGNKSGTDGKPGEGGRFGRWTGKGAGALGLGAFGELTLIVVAGVSG